MWPWSGCSLQSVPLSRSLPVALLEASLDSQDTHFKFTPVCCLLFHDHVAAWSIFCNSKSHDLSLQKRSIFYGRRRYQCSRPQCHQMGCKPLPFFPFSQ